MLDRDLLRSTLAVLSEYERQAIGLRFLFGLTQSEIAKYIGGSQMHVSRVLRRALTHINAGGDHEEPGTIRTHWSLEPER